MFLTTPTLAETLLLAGYVLFFMGMNIIALLISSFYKRKFSQSSPSLGFLVALLLSAIFIIYLFSGYINSSGIQLYAAIMLLGSALMSTFSIVNLFFTMRREKNK
ncbi:hypothetical protein QA601_05030 [Chitinispirillales bacterium ANBcel5]|uniref:hypothetical protein n=1 Tax=Cellulosispirillum alkaliphilum TaxID=3039283 RepID=UPI002A56E863|nr:hypothetical protein [Chitinispirillales bacterium ANBcel5]